MTRTQIKHYFQLLEVFTFREIKTRYRGSILGPLWLIINPIVSSLILNVVFGSFVRVDTGKISYFLFLFSGLIFWNFFHEGLLLSKDVFLWNRDLVTKTVFSKDTLPISFILSKIPDYFIYVAILSLFYLSNYHFINPYLVLILLPLIPLLLFSTGIALVISVANAIFRDFGKILDLFLMIVFYATPIIYPETLVPEKLQFIHILNPLAIIIIFTRNILFEGVIKWDLYIISVILGLTSLLSGYIFFRRIEKKMVDLI